MVDSMNFNTNDYRALAAEFISLHEAIVDSSTKNNILRSARENENSACEVYLTKDGRVNIGFPSAGEFSVYATLFFSLKRINLKVGSTVANKISSSAQQLLTALYKSGIIDNSWKVEHRDKLGYYNTSGKYINYSPSYANESLLFWMDRKNRIYIGDNLIFFHGTSTYELPSIKQKGLLYVNLHNVTSGTASRLKIPDNKKFIYLTPSIETAMMYAKERASKYNREFFRSQWDYMQHTEWTSWEIQPVILQVQIPDMSNLRSDDDRLIQMIKNKAYKIWDIFTPAQKLAHATKAAEWFKQHNINYTPGEISAFTWVMSDDGFEYVLPLIDKMEWKNWKKSLAENSQVAYEGIIPPKFISVVKLPT